MKVLIASILTMTLFLTGCSSKTEVRDRAFVQAVSTKYDDEKVAVSVRLFDDENCYSGEGEDFFSAVEDAELKQDKYFFTGHLEFIITENDKNRELLEELIKSNKVSPSCFMVYSDNAESIIKNIDCDKFSGILKLRSEKGEALKKDIWTVLEEINRNGFSETDFIKKNSEHIIISSEFKFTS